jgi:hypothetical protein
MIQFQGETDALNKRAKKAEEAFYSVYALMSEAPDPTPLLEAALQRQRHAAELEVENEKLNKTVKECVSVVAHVAVTPTHVRHCLPSNAAIVHPNFFQHWCLRVLSWVVYLSQSLGTDAYAAVIHLKKLLHC